MTTAADGLEAQRRSFRGYVVVWSDCAQVCCAAPGCPGVLTTEDRERIPALAEAAGWRVVQTEPLATYLCGGCR